MALSSTNIIKVIVVTDSVERSVAAYKKLLGTGSEPTAKVENRNIREPYTRYKGELITDTPMKVGVVYSDNFCFEILEPLGDNDPWAAWLKEHGPSIFSISMMTNGPIEKDEQFMAEAGYESIFKQEKGYEAYEYFDTSKDLGVCVEVKEHY